MPNSKTGIKSKNVICFFFFNQHSAKDAQISGRWHKKYLKIVYEKERRNLKTGFTLTQVGKQVSLLKKC